MLPLLSALKSDFKTIIVLNIDAHADTRTDLDFHSGTPFRQFANEFQGDFYLYQVGLHAFANSLSTMTALENGNMEVLWKNDILTEGKAFIESIKNKITDSTAVIFSLDADALNASCVPGVSAVNADGIDLKTLSDLWKQYSELPLHHSPILGIYELNPVYDSLASLSMRSLSTFLFQTLN